MLCVRQSVRVYEPLGTRRRLGLGGETKQLTALVFCLRSPVLTTHAKVRKACHKSSQQTNTTMRRPRKLTYRAKQRLPTSKHVGEDIVRHAACNTLAARCEPSLLKQAFLLKQAITNPLPLVTVRSPPHHHECAWPFLWLFFGKTPVSA